MASLAIGMAPDAFSRKRKVEMTLSKSAPVPAVAGGEVIGVEFEPTRVVGPCGSGLGDDDRDFREILLGMLRKALEVGRKELEVSVVRGRGDRPNLNRCCIRSING